MTLTQTAAVQPIATLVGARREREELRDRTSRAREAKLRLNPGRRERRDFSHLARSYD
jgi:hypothetical protein